VGGPDPPAITEAEIRHLYAIAEQWMATYERTRNPRHLATALACYERAKELRRALQRQPPDTDSKG
jgi:hypothetical protein